MFLHLSALLVWMILCNFSIRKLVPHRSNGIDFHRFCAWFSTSSQVSVWPHFLECFMQFGAPCGTIFQKKRFRKWLQKKVPTNMKTGPYQHVRRLPERPPRVSQTRKTARAQNAGRIGFHCSHFPTLARKCWLDWLQLQMFQAIVRRKMRSINVKSTLLMIWHVPGQGLSHSLICERPKQTNWRNG